MKAFILGKRKRLILRWSLLCATVTIALSVWIAVAWQREDTAVAAAGSHVDGLTRVLAHTVAPESVPIRFQEKARAMGINFHHFPARRESLLPEDMGSGVACGDFDNDGWTDLFFVNFAGNVLPDSSIEGQRGACRLYRNEQGRHFCDVTEPSGIQFSRFGMGAAWGDYDNDGDLDLYITAYGPNALFENQGDGTFREVTSEAGVQDARFSAGCSWGDYDRDGWIDLYVCNYVDFQFDPGMRGRRERQYGSEQPFTINPSAFPPQTNALFRNQGDGTFTEVGGPAGVADPEARSLSAAWADFDNDGWPDLYVANDVSQNNVYRNRGDGSFANVGPSSLAADYRGAMGIAVADIDRDRDVDLLITHWIAQENALYLNMKRSVHEENVFQSEKLWFVDAADQFGLGQSSLDMIGWATGFCDFDNDAWLDLWLVNGSTFESAADHSQLEPQLPLVFWRRGTDRFVNVAPYACSDWKRPMVGRGGAQLDFDRDGRMDLVFLVHGGEARLYHNTTEPAGQWVQVELRQAGQNRFALGAQVEITTASTTQYRQVGASPSYLSQDETILHFGLGQAAGIESLRIVWPDGREEVHSELPVNRRLVFARPAGSTLAASAEIPAVH